MTARRAIGATSAVPLAGAKIIPAHIAMKGQSFAQSGFFCVSGQHGMPAGMSAEDWSAATATV
jgi:hypothetical protein